MNSKFGANQAAPGMNPIEEAACSSPHSGHAVIAPTAGCATRLALPLNGRNGGFSVHDIQYSHIATIMQESFSEWRPLVPEVDGGRRYIGDTENKFAHLGADYLYQLGISLDGAAKMPDVIIHCTKRNWLLLIEAITSAGPVDGKRRKELKELFANSKSGLVFVTAFETRRGMQSFVSSIAWESEVWIADDPAHMIRFNGDKFLGPYPDTKGA